MNEGFDTFLNIYLFIYLNHLFNLSIDLLLTYMLIEIISILKLELKLKEIIYFI